MDLQLADQVAVVTGADSGIGWHTARLLLEEGARVAVTDQDADRLQEAARQLPGEPLVVPADLTRPPDLARLHADVLAKLGAPQILVHSAGVTGAQGLFHEIDDAGWRDTLEIDLFAAVSVVRAFLPELRASGRGRLVLLASEDAEQPYVDELPYCVAKAGILSLVKGLSKSYGADGLLVNAVSPAFVETPMTDRMMDKRADELGTDREQAIDSFLRDERPGMVLGRRGTPAEVAAVIAFLCSARASFVTGSNYRVDSGSVATI